MASIANVNQRALAEAPTCCGEPMGLKNNADAHQIVYRCGHCLAERNGRHTEDIGHDLDRGTLTPPNRESRMPQTTPATTTAPASEALSTRAIVARLDEIADAHHGLNHEGFLGSLARMEVGDGDQQKVRDAQEQSRLATEAWKLAAERVRAHNLPLQEAYANSPDAGNKQANTNE